MNRILTERVFQAALAACLLLTAGAVRAQEGEEPPGAAQWKAERTQLEELISAKVRTEVAKTLNPRRVAEAMNYPWPLKETRVSLAEMKAAIDKRATDEAEAKFPAAKEATFKEEGQVKFKLLKVGDQIDFTLRGGRGANAQVSGKIMRVTPDRLQVGTRTVATRDVDDDVLALLMPDANAKKVDEYVQREVRRYRVQRDHFMEDTREAITPQMMTESGYVRLKGAKPGKMDATAWQPMKTLFDAEVERQTAELAAAARKTIEPEVYKANHYVFFEKEWMPESVMQATLAKRAEENAPEAAPATPPGTNPATPATPVPPAYLPGPGGPYPPGMPPGMMPPGMPTPTPTPAPAPVPATPMPPVSVVPPAPGPLTPAPAPKTPRATPPANPNPTVLKPQVPDKVGEVPAFFQ